MSDRRTNGVATAAPLAQLMVVTTYVYIIGRVMHATLGKYPHYKDGRGYRQVVVMFVIQAGPPPAESVPHD
eukprot:1193867-Prorocentrum_minimum.AAC.1